MGRDRQECRYLAWLPGAFPSMMPPVQEKTHLTSATLHPKPIDVTLCTRLVI